MPRAARPHSPVHPSLRLRHISVAGMLMAAALMSSAAPAAAEQKVITIYSDQAKVLPIKGEPKIAIVGNPMYTDAKIDQGLLVLQGRHFGTTNVVVIDANGKELADYQVTVQQTPHARVTVYQAGGPVTFTCGHSCETTLEVGDSLDHFSAVQKEMQSKYQLATGAVDKPN